MRLSLLYCFLLPGFLFAGQAPQPKTGGEAAPLEKSAYFAFVDYDFIFTVEVVKAGIPLFNFVSMVDEEYPLPAKEITLAVETRKIPARYFLIDTGNPKEPVIVPSLQMRRRSAFGVRLQGDYGDAREFYGAAVRIGEEVYSLVPLSSFDFENLVLKVNRINLASPDFRDDWRVLKLDRMGVRSRARRR